LLVARYDENSANNIDLRRHFMSKLFTQQRAKGETAELTDTERTLTALGGVALLSIALFRTNKLRTILAPIGANMLLRALGGPDILVRLVDEIERTVTGD
jgi:uncharacterized membrane protein